MCVHAGEFFTDFIFFAHGPVWGVNINHPKVCLRVCACECVNTSVSKSLKLTTVALRCSELREGDPQRPTFYVKKHLHLYIITLKKTELEEQNYMCGAKVGKKNSFCVASLLEEELLKYPRHKTAAAAGRTPERTDEQITWILEAVIPHR